MIDPVWISEEAKASYDAIQRNLAELREKFSRRIEGVTDQDVLRRMTREWWDATKPLTDAAIDLYMQNTAPHTVKVNKQNFV